MFRILLIVVSLLSQLSFAQQDAVSSTQENITLQFNDNVSVVAWTGFNITEAFKKTPKLTNELFCSSDGAFKVKQDNYVTIDMKASFPDGFAEKFKEAVDKIKDKKDPILIVSLMSHGVEGIILRQTHSNISYDKFLDTLFENSFKVNKDITLILFVNACHSGSIIPIIKDKLSCKDRKKDCFEGIDSEHYKYKISVYTSAPSNESAKGDTEFLDGLNRASKQEDCKDKENCGLNDKGGLTFLLSKQNRRYVFWSSFSDKAVIEDLLGALKNTKDEKVRASVADELGVITQEGDKTVIKILLNILQNVQEDKETRSNAARGLGNIAQGNKTVIKVLVSTLKDDKDQQVRLMSAIALGKIAQGDRTAIDVLLYALKNDEDVDVRDHAAQALGSVAQEGDKEIIDALICAIKNDKAQQVRCSVADILGNIAKRDKTVIDTILYALKNDENEDVRYHAAQALGSVAQEGNKEIIEALIYAIKNDTDIWVRCSVADILGNIAKGDKETIEALNYVLKNDTDEFVLYSTNEALTKISPKGNGNSE